MAFDREARPARPVRGKRRKVCQFCADKCESIDYKDAAKPVSYTHLTLPTNLWV